MSETSLLISALNNLYQQAPKNATGVSGSIWDDLLALIQGVVQNIIDSANNSLSGLIGSVSSTIQDKIREVRDFVGGLTSDIYTMLFDQTTGVVKQLSDKIGGIAQQVIDNINNTFSGIGDAISGAIGRVVDAINSVIDAVKGIGQTIANSINGVIQSVAEWLKNAITSVAESVGSWLGGIVDTVSDWITTAYNNVKDWITTAIKNVGDWVHGAYDWISQAITAVGNWISTSYENVSQWVTGTFHTIIEWLGARLADFLAWKDKVLKDVSQWLETTGIPTLLKIPKLYDQITSALDQVWGAIASGDPQKALDLLDQLFKGLGLPAPSGILEGMLYFMAYLQETVKLKFVPMEVAATKYAEINLGLTPLDLSAAHDALERGAVSKEWYFENARIAGVNHNRAEAFLEASKPLTPPQVVKTVYLRGLISETQHDNILAAYGFESGAIASIKETYPEIPPITDLVHFADRFAWDDDIAKRFEYDTEFPDIVNEWASKIGLSPDWFKRYWRSHWQLPSLQDIFEMYHRLRPNEVDKAFNEDDLDAYLKTTPLPPYFHELLKEITYLPLTRVDIRRMYKSGVLSEDQVYKAYLDLGYDQIHAGWLKDFTLRYYTPEDQTQRDEFFSQARSAYSTAYKHSMISQDEYKAFLSGLGIHEDDVNLLISLDDFAISYDNQLFNLHDQRATMRKLALSAYDNGLLDSPDTISLLESLGYDNSQANLELSVVDYNKEMQDRQTLVDNLHDQFVGYMIDDTELHTIMGMFNFSGLEIDKLVASWNIEKSYRAKRPALSDLRRFLTQGILTLDDFLNELRGLGYSERYVDMYSKSLSMAKG